MSLDHLPLSKVVAFVLNRLENPGWPRGGIVSHFGVSVSWQGFDLGFNGGHDETNKHLLVTCYASSKIAHPKRTHDKHTNAIVRGAKSSVFDRWNGGADCSGVSVMLNRPVPQSLAVAMTNYRKLPDVFCLKPKEEARFRAFDRWWQRVST